MAEEWPLLAAMLRDKGIEFEECFTNHRYHAVELVISALKQGYRNFISVGGDGTIHEIVNGLFYQKDVPVSEVTLAVLPAGSGNDWVKMYCVPDDYSLAADVIVGRRTVLQDVCKVLYTEAGVMNARYMVNVAGVGLDANICYHCNNAKRDGGGKGSYIKALVKALLGRRFNHAEVIADGKLFFKGKMLSVGFGIGRYSGGGILQVPDAVAHDGLVNVMVGQKLLKIKFLFLFRYLFSGRMYDIKGVSHIMARKFEVRTARPDRVEIDGEVVGTTPMSVQVLPNALRIVVGKSYKEGGSSSLCPVKNATKHI